MSEIVYVNGQFCTQADARISVFDHGLLYGDGVFEGIRFYSRNIFRLREHLERLQSSAKYIMLDIRRSATELEEIVVETCRRNGLEDGYIRLIVTRGVGSLGLNPFVCEEPGIICIVSRIQLYPKEFYEKGLPIVTVSTRRNAADAVSPRVKSLNYLNNIMAKIEAIHCGVLEAIMLDSNGYIVECTGDNFFLVKKGVLFTPPIWQGALKGVTRDAVIQLARANGVEVREERLTLYEAYDADECFLTGTAAEIVPVKTVDNRRIGDGGVGPVTRLLTDRFHEIVLTDGVLF